MVPPDRVDELEGRIARLEHLVLELVRDRAPPVRSPVSPPSSPGLASSTVGRERIAWEASAPPARSIPAVPPRPAGPSATRAGWSVVSEQWLGQRGFLAAGVVAALAAVGYFLLLAFQRGWISPAVRSLGGAILGLGVAAFGWRLYQRGLSRYGAALIGAGIGIDYLTAWAATRLYGFIPTAGGAVTLAGLSVLLAAIALLLDVQWLAAAGVVGGLLGPLLLGVGAGTGNLYLAYLGSMVLLMGGVAVARRWRLTARLLAVFATVLLGFALEGGAGAFGLAVYGAVIGLAGIMAGTRLGWGGVRLGGFLAGWLAVLFGTAVTMGAPLLVLIAGSLLAVPAWLAGLRGDVAPWRMPGESPESGGEALGNEALFFYATSFFLAVVLADALSAGSDFGLAGLGQALVLIGLTYLGVGLVTTRPPFELVAALGLGFGSVLMASSPVVGYWYLLLQVLAWTGSDHLLHRRQGRWFALIPLAGAAYLLGSALYPAPPAGDPAFIGQVSQATWGGIAIGAMLAAGLWRQEGPNPRFRVATVPQFLWAATGLLVLVGVTREISWYFLHADIAEPARSLAGGLAVSAWWALFAGVVVLLGFRLRNRPVRIAGLLVAGIAAAKVIVVDLSTLEALYRVASVMTLAVVFLGVSYLYNRAAHAGIGGTDPSPGR